MNAHLSTTSATAPSGERGPPASRAAPTTKPEWKNNSAIRNPRHPPRPAPGPLSPLRHVVRAVRNLKRHGQPLVPIPVLHESAEQRLGHGLVFESGLVLDFVEDAPDILVEVHVELARLFHTRHFLRVGSSFDNSFRIFSNFSKLHIDNSQHLLNLHPQLSSISNLPCH